MPTLLEKVSKARDDLAGAEQGFRAILATAKEAHSWAELAAVAHLSPSGVRYLVAAHKKGEHDA